ncbi:MAG TPA: cytochrome c oxidase subunit 3 [Vicinamibacterales bacterium]|nr:cytochrome c oxidase subunit 3 [Vicinamibacterales bacterium]
MIIPYTTERRADTGMTNVTLGMWLFIASEVMLFGALFSAYALLRVSATDWPPGRDLLNLTIGAVNTVVLAGVTASAWRARRSPGPQAGRWLAIGVLLALAFLGLKGWEYSSELGAGLRPATSTFLAMYFTLTGLHALHVVAGIIANVWAIAGISRVTDAMTAGRTRSLALYWVFVDIVWLIIFGLMYLL